MQGIHPEEGTHPVLELRRDGLVLAEVGACLIVSLDSVLPKKPILKPTCVTRSGLPTRTSSTLPILS